MLAMMLLDYGITVICLKLVTAPSKQVLRLKFRAVNAIVWLKASIPNIAGKFSGLWHPCK